MKQTKHTKRTIFCVLLLLCLFASGAAQLRIDAVSPTPEDTECPVCGSTGIGWMGDHFSCGGTWAYMCGDCGHTWSKEATILHDYEYTTVLHPTCTETGTESYDCYSCAGNVAGFSGQREIPALGHEYKESNRLNPTCTEKGYIVYTCSRINHNGKTVCGDSYTEDIPALGHQWDDGVITKAPTCTQAGTRLYTCTRNNNPAANIPCGQTRTESIPATGHSWSSWTTTKAATCTAAGTEERHCTHAGCTEKETRSIPATGHSWSRWTTTKAATCTVDGTQERHCTNSGCTEKESNTIPATGHNWSSWTTTKAATCPAAGTQERHCTNSGCTEKESNSIPATGHSYPENWTIAKKATQNDEGLETKTCSICGNLISQAIPRLTPAPVPGGEDPQPSGGEDPQPSGGEDPQPSGGEDPRSNQSPAAPGNKFPLPAILGLAAAAAAIGFMAYKVIGASKAAKAAAAMAASGIVAKNIIPDFSRKYVYNLLNGSGFSEKVTEELKDKRYIKYAEGDRENTDDLPKEIRNEKPDLVIMDLDKDHSLEDNLHLIEDINKICKIVSYSFVVDDCRKDCLPRLEELKAEGTIRSYVTSDVKPVDGFVKLILPMYKPVISAEGTLENIGKISDKLGIPFVSAAVSVHSTILDLRDDTAANGFSIDSARTIVASIADVMGWEKITEVSDFIDDVQDKKDLVEEEKLRRETGAKPEESIE